MNTKKNADITLAELYDLWLSEKNKSIGETTKRLYRKYYDKYIPESLGSRAVKDISYDEWTVIESKMIEGTAPNGLNMPKTTLRQVRSVLHAAFKYGKATLGLNDPAEGMQVSSRHMYTVTVFTKSEIKKMRSAAKPFDIPHICIMLCLYTGVEVTEICAVRWADIDIENKLLKIRGVVGKANHRQKMNKDNLAVHEPKNKKVIRDMPIPTWLAEQLEIMKPMHGDEEYLLSGTEKVAYPNTFRQQYAYFLRDAGVEKRMINALRHTFAMTCIKKNVDVKTLSEMLGHSNSIVTIRMYYGTQTQDKRKLIETLYD